MNPEDREDVMKHWDSWRKYIADGGGGSWPRDAFESLLDYYDEKLSVSQQIHAADAMMVRNFHRCLVRDGYQRCICCNKELCC